MDEDDEIEYGFPYVQAGLLAAIFILGVLMEAFNWFPGL